MRKSDSFNGDSCFEWSETKLMGNLRDFHMLGRRIGINRQWFLLRSSIWMRYPEDQSQGLRGMRFGIIKRRSFTSVLESRNLAPLFHYHVVGKIWTLIWISLGFLEVFLAL